MGITFTGGIKAPAGSKFGLAPFDKVAAEAGPPVWVLSTATFDPLFSDTNTTLSNNNLTLANTFDTNWRASRSTASITTGKWYWEVTNTIDGQLLYGVTDSTDVLNDVSTSGVGWTAYDDAGNLFGKNGTATGTGPIVALGQTVGIMLDADAGSVQFLDTSGVLSGGSWAITPNQTFYAAVACALSTATINFGATSFVHTVPAGYNGT